MVCCVIWPLINVEGGATCEFRLVGAIAAANRPITGSKGSLLDLGLANNVHRRAVHHLGPFHAVPKLAG